ncbi:molybdenum cofactor guanylyltransferase MobA [Haliea sp. E1-2-M8]|uniref:molybdenum cofactor guanylyltransferase MobA n=1 Tax=Haliea sp. E1-2-M8 TaxID=3064706 RepID=UPI002721214C|nr:molybdenum cofactor guanylyltransferase MobA [Haliea sp. E1-2-M8]MDO8860778.1 molybdenum cofactor guanylyltransferase MobA [Haliea sp. E1-2-M8]
MGRAQTPAHFDGLILAGGAGRRAGGRDKGLLDWEGRPLVAWVSERLRPQTSHLQISCNRNLDVYAGFGDSVFADRQSGFQGPLAGLEAFPTDPTREFLLVVPCDTPRLPLDLAARLYQALTKQPESCDLAYATAGGQHHYLHMLLRRRCLGSLPAYLASGGRSVRGWQAQLRCISVDFAAAGDAFDNHNQMQART